MEQNLSFDAVIEEPQSDWSGEDEEYDRANFGYRGRGKSKKKSLDESGLPLIPELMKYNDRFDHTSSKRKAKEREKIYEVFSKIKQDAEK